MIEDREDIDYDNAIIKYMSKQHTQTLIQEMIKNNKRRLILNLDNIREFNEILARAILTIPLRVNSIFEAHLNEMAQEQAGEKIKTEKDKTLLNKKIMPYRVTFEGAFGRNMVSPRGLTSELTNQLVCVQGIVTRMSIVRPKLVYSVHYCDETKQGSIKEYYDHYATSNNTNMNGNFDGKAASYMTNSVPSKDMNGNPLTFEYGVSHFKDFQTLLVQEPPERTPVGQLPRSVEVILEEDLVDKVKPGDRIQVVGIFKCVSSQSTTTSGIVRTVLIASNIQSISGEILMPKFRGEDIRNIKELSGRNDIFDILANSFAPSIYGHQFIKKAMILQLMGGTEKNLENGTHLRGDINVLLIGDPSTAKSQFLRHMLNLAPNAINTTGRGSSGVGLTAAVVTDKDTGERHLEAGAMVLGDRGVVCIDEFDKMNENDRVAIHEVMEQQTVTIAKAGIHVSLNARCSVLAAANPIYGQYQKDLQAAKNIGLPDSLLSRFDLVFIVLDEHSSTMDSYIADRVIRNHMFTLDTPSLLNNFDEKIIEPEIRPDIEEEVEVFEKYNELLHGKERKEILTRGFLRKYLHYAKKTATPGLSEEAVTYISQAWTKLRSKSDEDWQKNYQVVPITVRTLETLIRLSTAHAKLRLAKNVNKKDCEIAFELLAYALYHETGNENDSMMDEEEAIPIGKKIKSDLDDEENRMEGDKKVSPMKKKDEDESEIEKLFSSQASIGPVTEAQRKFVYKIIYDSTHKESNQSILFEDLWKLVTTHKDSVKVHKISNKSDLLDIVLSLDTNGRVLYSDESKEITLI